MLAPTGRSYAIVLSDELIDGYAPLVIRKHPKRSRRKGAISEPTAPGIEDFIAHILENDRYLSNLWGQGRFACATERFAGNTRLPSTQCVAQSLFAV